LNDADIEMQPSVLFSFRLTAVFGVLVSMVAMVTAVPRRPPNYQYDSMPDTSFTCDNKVVSGYYADPDADCQMFHICVQVNETDVRDFKFMCPDDTVFDQENFICANWFEIDCLSSTFYYDKNLQLFQPMDPESSADNSTGFSNVTEMPTELQLRQQQEQLFQLKILEDKQQEQVMKQQQIIELHELRQQEHQRNQFQIIAKQQQDQEDQRIEDQDGTRIGQASRNDRSALQSSTAKPMDDYYYYDGDEALEDEEGNFYTEDDYDIIDPGKGSPALAAILLPSAKKH